jgi:two-component system, chemotaxis family, protein-glutamate methylesterase/glutaminase
MPSSPPMEPLIEAIAIGGSAGALDALGRILPALPPTFPVPIVLVLHIPPGKPNYLPEVLGAMCALRVKEAEDKEPLERGILYTAPADYHLLVEKQRVLSLSIDEPVLFSRPAIEVLFDSAADAYGENMAGVLLAGASEDGVRGLAHIKRAGGLTLVQAPDTAAVRMMPQAALDLGVVDHALAPDALGSFLAKLGEQPL